MESRRGKKSVLVFGGCWPTNIGNAFINLGAMASLRSAVGTDAEIHYIGGMSQYIFWLFDKPENCFQMADLMKCDYFVIAGMTQWATFLEGNAGVMKHFSKRGSRIVVAGGGGCAYDRQEIESVRRFMKDVPIYAFVSRDTFSYENYGDLAEHSLDGIDSGFFVSESAAIPALVDNGFVVVNFDQLEEPRFVNFQPFGHQELFGPVPPRREVDFEIRLRKFLRTVASRVRHPRRRNSPPTNDRVIDLHGRKLLRAHHNCVPGQFPEHHLAKPDTLFSDLPWDFLTLYKHAHAVYSDRVHCCVASLAYGNRAMLFGTSNPRIRLFQRVGAAGILDEAVQCPEGLLSEVRAEQVAFLKRVIV